MAEANSGGSGGVAAVAIVVLVVLVVLVGGYLFLGRGGSLSGGHTSSVAISTPAGPITGKATTN